MHSLRSSLPLTIAILMAASTPLPGQARPNMAPGYQQTYDRMLQQIRQIAILDDHGHPGFADDSDVDAMAVGPSHPPFRIRSGNPELIDAAKSLFSYPYNDDS